MGVDMIVSQMKLREEREARRASMDGRHEYVLSTVADRLEMSMEDAEEFMLDGDQVGCHERGEACHFS